MKFVHYINQKIAPVTLSGGIQAFFAAFALGNIGNFSPAGILSVVIFGLVLLFFVQTKQKLGRCPLPRFFAPITAALALLFTGFYVAAERQSLSGTFDSRLFRIS